LSVIKFKASTGTNTNQSINQSHQYTVVKSWPESWPT